MLYPGNHRCGSLLSDDLLVLAALHAAALHARGRTTHGRVLLLALLGSLLGSHGIHGLLNQRLQFSELVILDIALLFWPLRESRGGSSNTLDSVHGGWVCIGRLHDLNAACNTDI